MHRWLHGCSEADRIYCMLHRRLHGCSEADRMYCMLHRRLHYCCSEADRAIAKDPNCAAAHAVRGEYC